ncbi:hypothetical protein B5S31_g1328 [[Candida] boidinii]|nr:hypothetical protein B5S31_g1328 [[Candida] boidinii]
MNFDNYLQRNLSTILEQDEPLSRATSNLNIDNQTDHQLEQNEQQHQQQQQIQSYGSTSFEEPNEETSLLQSGLQLAGSRPGSFSGSFTGSQRRQRSSTSIGQSERVRRESKIYNSSNYPKLRLFKIILFIVLFIFLIGSLIGQIKDRIISSIYVELNGLELNPINTNGITGTLKLTLKNNYDQIKNNYIRNLIIFTSSLINYIYINSNSYYRVFYKDIYSPFKDPTNSTTTTTETFSLFNLNTQDPLKLSLVNGAESYNEIKFFIDNVSEGSGDLISRISNSLSDGEISYDKIPIELEALLDSKIEINSFFTFNLNNFKIKKLIELDLISLIDTYHGGSDNETQNSNKISIVDYSLTTNEQETMYDFNSTIKLNYLSFPIKFEIPETNWKLYLNSCEKDDQFQIVSLHLDSFKIDTVKFNDTAVSKGSVLAITKYNSPNLISLNVNLKPFDSEIDQVICKSTGTTVFQNFVNKLLSNDTASDIEFFVKNSPISNHNDNEAEIPHWFIKLLNRLNLKFSNHFAYPDINISLNLNETDSKFNDEYINRTNINNLFIQINKDSNDDLEDTADLTVTSDLSVILNNGINSFKKSAITSGNGVIDFIALEGPHSYVNINLHDIHQIHNLNDQQEEYNVKIKDMGISIKDPNYTNELIKQFTNTSNDISLKNIDLYLNNEFNFNVESLITNFSINEFEFNSSLINLPILNLKDNKKNLKLLDKLNLRFNNFTLINSNESEIEILIDFQIFNFLNTNLGLLINENNNLKISLMVNETTIGNIKTFGNNFLLNANSYNNLTAIMKLETNHLSDKVTLENLLGKYISGKESICLLGFTNDSISNNLKLSKSISNLKVPINMPIFKSGDGTDDKGGGDGGDGDGDGDDDGDGENKRAGGGFLIGSTMHLMSSQIEITMLNPFSNCEIMVTIIEARAKYKDTLLGYINEETVLVVPPGIYTTPRIPIKYDTSGVGSEILRKALNGELKVEVEAIFKIRLDNYELELLYAGSGVSTKIRL